MPSPLRRRVKPAFISLLVIATIVFIEYRVPKHSSRLFRNLLGGAGMLLVIAWVFVSAAALSRLGRRLRRRR